MIHSSSPFPKESGKSILWFHDEDRKQEQSFWFHNKPYNFICKRYMYKNIVKNEVLNELLWWWYEIPVLSGSFLGETDSLSINSLTKIEMMKNQCSLSMFDNEI